MGTKGVNGKKKLFNQSMLIAPINQ